MMLSQKLCCLTFCLAVCASYFCLPVGSAGVVRRSRRSAAATRRVFVVRLSDSGALFTVGSVPPGATDRFQFVDSTPPPGLVLDGSTGMISKSSSAQWNAPTEIKFQVTSPAGDTSVTVHVVDRGDDDAIFTNRPVPLWTTCPVWIRPSTVIYTVKSVDRVHYGSDVHYRLESGGDGKFGVNATTGDIFVIGRQMFDDKEVYRLAISSEAVGAASKSATPTQVVSVQVGYRAPQLHLYPYNVSVYENDTENDIVLQLEAKSFQSLPLQFRVMTDDAVARETFSVSLGSGRVTLMKTLSYAASQHLYLFNLSVTERYSNFVTHAPLTINLLPVNHEPFFPRSYYVVREFSESATVGQLVTTVEAIDLDVGDFGKLTYTVSDSLFAIEQDGGSKTARIVVNGALDYDYLPDHKYEFKVIATDGGSPPLSGSAIVQVWMKNVNDEAPVFEPSSQVVRVKKGANEGFVVYTVQVFDPDGDCVTFDAAQSEYLMIDRTGKITLRKSIHTSLNIAALTLSVTARDDSSCCEPRTATRSNTTTITVQIIGVNTQPTFPQCHSYRAAVRENAPINTIVLEMDAVDRDSGVNGQLSYSVIYQLESNRVFGVRPHSTNPSRAVLYSLVSFDRESSSYDAFTYKGTVTLKVTVKVQDSGTPPLSTNCFLNVAVDDENDNSPSFDYTDDFYQTNILVSGATNDRVYRVYATDADAGDNGRVSYTLSATTPDCRLCFSIDQSSGWITRGGGRLQSSQTYSLRVVATDGGDTPRSSTATVKVHVVSDARRLPPQWQLIGGQHIDDLNDVSVSEDVTANTLITNINTLRLVATSSQGQVQYHLSNNGPPELNGGNEAAFKIPSPNPFNDTSIMPIATSSRNLDASTVPSYVLRCRAFTGDGSSDNSLVAVARLRVHVQDVNDKSPQFQGVDVNGNYPAAVSDYTTEGDEVIYVSAIDVDADEPNNVVSYSFHPNCGVDCNSFSLNSSSGRILAEANDFDRSQKNTYTLRIVAQDGAPSSLQGTSGPNQAEVRVAVTVIGSAISAPRFTRQEYTVTIDENTSRLTNFLNVTADSDPTDFTEYSIESGNDCRVFAVDVVTGSLYIVGKLSYTRQKKYTLICRVSDGVYSDVTTVMINLRAANMYPPIFTRDEYIVNDLVEKDQSAVGRLITTIAATDPDQFRPGTITYDIYAPTGTLSTSADQVVNSMVIYQSMLRKSFSVNRSTGAVSLRRALSRDFPFGFSRWEMNVVAADESGSPTSESGYGVVIVELADINDHAPVFDTCCLRGSVREDASQGVEVLQLYASDPDNGLNGSVTFSLAEQSQLFAVSVSGRITTVAPASSFDRETRDTHYLIVHASDAGNPPNTASAQVVIEVTDANDNAPQLSQRTYTVTVDELMPVGSPVITLAATDLDIGINARMTYTIDSSDDSEFFYADSIYAAGTAVIRIKQPLIYHPSKTAYQISVKVSDGTSAASTASVTINVVDINNHAPSFTPAMTSVQLSKDVPVGFTVATVTASDADFGLNANFKYFVDYRNTDRKFNFKVDEITGIVKIRTKLDMDVKRSFSLHILAIDAGTPSMTGTATIAVSIVDANDNAPVIKYLPNYPLVVRAEAKQGHKVFCFTAEEQDMSLNPSFTFTYICSSAAACNDFVLQQTQNEACLIAKRDDYRRSTLGFKSYTLSVNISDNSEPQQWAVQQFTLIIESTNDSPPQPGSKTMVVNTYNGVFDNVPVGYVYVNDTDDWDLDDFTFSFADSPPSQDFKLNQETGQLLMLAGTRKGDHVIRVNVEDKKWQKTVTCTVTVTVVYLNDSVMTSSASLRLAGVGSASQLLDSSESKSQDRLSLLKQKIADLLDTGPDNIDIISVRDAADTPGSVDVTYAAHGSPYYTPEKLDALVWMNRRDIKESTGLDVAMAPVELCMDDYTECWTGGCVTEKVVVNDAELVESNSSSFVGIDVTYVRSCRACGSAASGPSSDSKCSATSCLNDGVCQQSWDGYNCSCPVGFEGPRCQQTKITFSGNSGYVVLKPLESCERDKLSFEFMTTTSTGSQLLFYTGPISDPSTLRDFMAVELINGFPQLRLSLGDGEVVLPSSRPSVSLSDGNWHSVEVFRVGREVRMVVDHCSWAPLEETIASSYEDRVDCDFNATVPGEKFLLAPLPVQLGGRIVPRYPSGLTSTGFGGCIKNFIHNGELYDLHVGPARLSRDAEDGCSSEHCSQCPGNSTCVGSMNSGSIPTCTCHPGLRGDNCDEFTVVKEFESADSYALWTPQPSYSSVNISSQKDAELSVVFRTRQTDGVLFFAASFSRLEHVILEIVKSQLQFRYDLGTDEYTLRLDEVNVSDGMRHVARVTRYGNQAILRLDSGEGRFYAERWPTSDHRALRLDVASSGEVTRNVWTDEVSAHSLINTCIQDVRYAGTLFPMDAKEYSSPPLVRVETRSLSDNCESAACGNIALCPDGQFCYDMWRATQCRCYDPTYQVNPGTGLCEPVPDCSVDHCYHGDCVVVAESFACNCYEGWSSTHCNVTGPVTAPTTGDDDVHIAAIIVPIIVGLILLLILLILLVLWLRRRRKPDYLIGEPDQDVRENMGFYDEEGAGEEDIHAYDLSRLQKPIDQDVESVGTSVKKWPDLSLSRSGPEPLSDQRAQNARPPGDFPEIGDFIADRLRDPDTCIPPSNDDLQAFNQEGIASQGGSLSSIESGASSDEGQDFDYLDNWGPPFQKLADLYGDNNSSPFGVAGV